jgi:hypothetical protein
MAKLVRIVIQLPLDLKTRLDGLKQQGYTTSGFIRASSVNSQKSTIRARSRSP